MQVLGPPTFGLAGHGLLIAPRCPCRATVTAEDHLVIAHGEREVARFVPGTAPADGEPRWLDDSYAKFGADGPSLMLDGASFDEVFVRVDVGTGALPWTALGRGFATELPPDVILCGAGADDEDWGFELHVLHGRNEFIGFQHVPATARVQPGPDQSIIDEAAFSAIEPDGSRREIQVTELAYTHDGHEWRAAVLRVPLGDDAMLVRAQATIANRDHLFASAKHVAATLGPIA